MNKFLIAISILTTSSIPIRLLNQSSASDDSPFCLDKIMSVKAVAPRNQPSYQSCVKEQLAGRLWSGRWDMNNVINRTIATYSFTGALTEIFALSLVTGYNHFFSFWKRESYKPTISIIVNKFRGKSLVRLPVRSLARMVHWHWRWWQ